MRIAIISHGVTDQSTLGGPGRVAAAHARELTQRGHGVKVVTTDLVWKGRREMLPTFDLLGVTSQDQRQFVHCAPAWSFAQWPGSLGPVFSPQAQRFVREAVRWADVVHAHEWPVAMTQSARRACSRYGTPLIVQPHGSVQTRHGMHRLLHEGYNAFNRPGPEVSFVAGTAQEADEIRDGLRSHLTIHTLVNPISLSSLGEHDSKVARRRSSWGCEGAVRIILYAHRIVPNKGLDMAIEALDLLPEDNHLVVVGEDGGVAEFSGQCRSLAIRLGLARRVHFVGPVGRAEIDEVILAADVFILPARRDTFPMMVLHAMACGRPVVVTKGCQSVETLSGAVAVTQATAAGIAEGLLSLNAAAARALGARGRVLMEERFSPTAVGSQLEAIYAATKMRQAG